MNCEQVRSVTQAYVDRELDAAASAEVAAHLRSCAACAEIELAETELSRALRTTPGLRFSPSFQSRARLQRALETRDHGRAWTKSLLLALAAAAAGAALVFVALQPNRNPQAQIVQDLVNDHIRSLMVAHLEDVPSTDQHTVKPWFAGKLDFSPPVVDLQNQGFELTGGRLDYAAGRPVAALVYRRRMHVINLFVWPGDSAEQKPRGETAIQGYNVIRWSRGGMQYTAVSDLAAAELSSFAELLYGNN